MAARIDQQDPGAFNNLGVLYFSKGMYPEAVDAFLNALSLDARMRTAARNLEVAAARPGACDARLSAVDERLAANPDDLPALRDRGRLLRLIGRTTEAVQQLDALIAEDPDDAVALFERGQVEQRAGDLRRAQRWLERAVNAAPQEPIARLHLAEVLYQRGQNEQALAALDAVLSLDATIADAHLLRGFVLGDMGRHEAAVAASRQASALNPSLQALHPNLTLDGNAEETKRADQAPADGALAHYGLGLAFRQRGYFDEAKKEFERALLVGEDAALTHHALAELSLVMGRFGAARAEYGELLREQPTNARFWNEHGVALHQGGDLHGAAESYRTALRHAPRFAMAYNNLGVALFDLGDGVGSRESLARAAELDPSLVRARLNLAMWYSRKAEPLAALGVLRDLVSFHPHDADAWHAFGLLCVDLRWLDEARGALARAIEERATHAEARYALAQVLASLGDADGALRETQQALAISAMRTEPRMRVSIDLQRECPDACGSLDLLAIRGGDPLQGVALDSADVASMLPDQRVPHVVSTSTVHGQADEHPEATSSLPAVIDRVAEATRATAEGDAFAARGLFGESHERFAVARALLEPTHAEPDAEHYAVWRHAAVGEARSMCLLDRGETVLSLLKTLGAHDARDAEVLALFARSLACADSNAIDAVRKTILRILRLEPSSAALMHFVGDTAMRIADEGLALGCYRRALTLDPARPSPRVTIARLLRTRGDLLAARLELVAALTAAPGLREAVLELVQVHREADRPHDALSLLTRHLEKDGTDLDALVLLAETLVRLGRDDDARVALTRVLRRAPDHLHATWLDGVLLARQSRLRDAIERWRRVAEGDGDRDLTAKAARALAKFDAPRLQLVS